MSNRNHKHTEEILRKVWCLRKKGHSFQSIADHLESIVGNVVSTSTIASWVDKVNADAAIVARAEDDLASTPVPGTPAPKATSRTGGKAAKRTAKNNGAPDNGESINQVVHRLRDEVDFLMWWNLGERRRFVDRLLDQIQE